MLVQNTDTETAEDVPDAGDQVVFSEVEALLAEYGVQDVECSETFFFRPTPSWLPPGRPTRSIVCYKLGRMVNWCKNGRLLIEWRQE